MKPLCRKECLRKMFEIVAVLVGIPMDISFIMKMNENSVWILIVVPFTCILVYLFFAIIYWLIQPTVLIYQYDTGIVIKRNIKIEYTSIERVYYKNYCLRSQKEIITGIRMLAQFL